MKRLCGLCLALLGTIVSGCTSLATITRDYDALPANKALVCSTGEVRSFCGWSHQFPDTRQAVERAFSECHRGQLAQGLRAPCRLRAVNSSYAPPEGGADYGTTVALATVQECLARLGYEPGPADGLYRSATADALSRFQFNNHLRAGTLDAATLERLAAALPPSGTSYSFPPSTGQLSLRSIGSSTTEELAYLLRAYSRGIGAPLIAENGSYYGEISAATGRPKTVYVRGYYRKDGTYVRGHYRSRPRAH